MCLRIVKKLTDKNGKMIGVVAVVDKPKPELITLRREDLKKYTFDNARITADSKVCCSEIVPVERIKQRE